MTNNSKQTEKHIEDNFRNLYFIGAGGIGMANLVRYFLASGYKVAGYDRTESELSQALEREGAILTYTDDPAEVPSEFKNPDDTLVVYTPAVPLENKIFTMFREGGFTIVKRAVVLGRITRSTESVCVAGSHGKTTTSSMIANILRESEVGCNAFLGGILRNTGSNLVLNTASNISVIEADEYDRSFHQLSPHIAVVTSVDPDHLDIYGDEEGYLEGFAHFTSLIKPGGYLIMHTGLKLKPAVGPDVKIFTYSAKEGGDWHAEDITFSEGKITFTLCGPGVRIENLEPGVPVEINIDNAVAAAAAAWLSGATEDDIRRGLAGYKGAKRRFEILRDGTESAFAVIDDYAHSPNEIKASIQSIRKLYPERKLTVIFQPHLYSRTRDFADGFAESLSEADEVIMPEIYAARELPIEGVSSQMILDKVDASSKIYCERKDLPDLIKNRKFELVMTLGAADLDLVLPEILACADSLVKCRKDV